MEIEPSTETSLLFVNIQFAPGCCHIPLKWSKIPTPRSPPKVSEGLLRGRIYDKPVSELACVPPARTRHCETPNCELPSTVYAISRPVPVSAPVESLVRSMPSTSGYALLVD